MFTIPQIGEDVMEKKKLTTAAGAPVVDNNNVITAGPRGPMLLQDVWFLEKLAHFDREVIPERRITQKALVPLVHLRSLTILRNILELKFSLKWVKKQKCLLVFQQ